MMACSVGGRDGFAAHPGAVGACEQQDDGGVHACQQEGDWADRESVGRAMRGQGDEFPTRNPAQTHPLLPDKRIPEWLWVLCASLRSEEYGCHFSVDVLMERDTQITVRQGTIEDVPFLRQMLFEALFWSPDYLRPPLSEFVNKPEFKKLLGNWGRDGDSAVIAQAGETPVGAAWYRFWSADNHSYGFVDTETPELGMAVSAGFRSKGIGRNLLKAILEVACHKGIRSMSLSVDPHNFALQLYESEGFTKVGESGTSWTMMKELTEKL